MAKTLKDQNRLGLTLVVLANVVALYGLVAAAPLANADWIKAGEALARIVPAGLGAILIGVLNAQLDATMKARIVFLRWNDPLAGCRAFTKLAPKDSRIDMDGLKKRLGELPTEPAAQNSTWYRLYREVADKPAILHANKEYLFTRDYHVLAIGMLVAFSLVAIWALPDLTTRLLYIGAMVLQVLITGQAARNHGDRLVCNVLALSTPLVPASGKTKKK